MVDTVLLEKKQIQILKGAVFARLALERYRLS